MLSIPILAGILILAAAAILSGSLGLLCGCCLRAAGAAAPVRRECATCEHGRFGMRDNTARCGQCVREKGAPGWERRQ